MELEPKMLFLPGISYREGFTGVVIYEHGVYHYYEHEKLLKDAMEQEIFLLPPLPVRYGGQNSL